MPRSLVIYLILPMLFLLSTPAIADSWLPATEQEILSADKLAGVTIIPRPLEGPLAYFKDKADGKRPAGQRKGSRQTSPIGTLERRGSDGRWTLVWQRSLVNDVAPVSALVANEGRYFVTFDNWHLAGYGDDTVVIYNAHGGLIRKMALTDFLPKIYVKSLRRSVSSLWWGQDHYLTDHDETLVLRVAEPGEDMASDGAHSVDVRVHLADGRVLPHKGANWDQALAKASKLDEQRQARWQALRSLRASPLTIPQRNDASAWREYLVELRERLNVSSGHRYSGLVLPLPGDGHYPDSADGIADSISDFADDPESSIGYFIFVSPSPERLANLLIEQMRTIKQGALKGAHIAFVGTPEQGAHVRVAAKKVGAEVILIDARVPFPGMPLSESMPEWFR